MITLKKSLIAAVAMVAGSAYAVPQWVAGDINAVSFNSYENQYRSAVACGAVPGSCFAATANDPAGWQRVNPTIVGNVFVGDVFVGVLDVYGIQPSAWSTAANDQFTGYFAHKVTNVDVSGGLTQAVVQLGAVSSAAEDPFGIMAAGQLFRLYVDSSTDLRVSGAGLTVNQSISSATDGTYWGALGLTGSETYAYTVTNLTIAGANQDYLATTRLALDVVNMGAGYNLPDVKKVNDASESLQGGVATNNNNLFGDTITCTAADLASASVSCSDMVGLGQLQRNALANSPWFYQVNDPLYISTVPEPASLALVGLAMAGVAAARRKSRKAA